MVGLEQTGENGSELDSDDLVLNIEDLQRASSLRMSKMAREFFNSGALYQLTLKNNIQAFDKYFLRPSVFVDVSTLDTTVRVFGQQINFPLCVSPTAIQKLAHPDGELATSAACVKHGIIMGMSSFSSIHWDDITQQGKGILNYAAQMYIPRNRNLLRHLVKLAEDVGCRAILLTVDSPILGTRWNESRNKFRAPPDLTLPVVGQFAIDEGVPPEELFSGINDPSQNWERDIPFLRSITKMQIWAKGILTAEDTLKAIEYKIDGIIVSNHGGRQLDGVPATLDALLGCVDAARGIIPVHVDGGFRRGSDIFKALAIGAECCWVGRPVIWGLAYDGQKGVELGLAILEDEFRKCMQLMGCRSVRDISRRHLAVMDSNGFLKRLDWFYENRHFSSDRL